MVVRYYVSYKLSYREIEEILAERGINVDHSTLNRWVIRFAPLLEIRARQLKRPVSSSWRMDETYINIKGEWWYYYRAVDKHGDMEIVDIKYLNNIVEQSHRPIKQKMVQALGWKSVEGATATMSGQEVWTQIKRGQVGDLSLPVWERFYALAA